jgi:hypothetical protein
MSSYGCFNRNDYKDQKLYGLDSLTGVVIAIEIPHAMSRDCQYSKFDKYADPKCVGCSRKQEPE